MRTSKVVIWLSWLIVVLAVVATAVGLFWEGGHAPSSFTTVREQTIELYGRGLYDSVFIGAGNKGTDAVTLILGVPLLMVSSLLYRKGSLRSGLLLVSVLAYFLYVYVGYALGVAVFNELFLVYVTLFSASLYAFVLAFASVDLQALSERFSPRLPYRGLSAFMLASALVTLVV
jgi:hypothetical protein